MNFLYKKIRKLPEYFNFIKHKYFRPSTKDIFRNIYLNNDWNDMSSYSGSGSNLVQTESIVKKLPEIIEKYKIKSFLDIPCGDFYWMKELNFQEVNYIGADIVEDLIKKNNREFAKDNKNFKILDLTSDRLPYADLIFCRDCLVHLSFEDIFKALKNIKRTKFKYLMTTNFLNHQTNLNIPTGYWRKINLCRPPFYFIRPIENVYENCSEGKDNEFGDKALSIWEVKSIPK